MNKVKAQGIEVRGEEAILPSQSKSQTDVMLAVSKWAETIEAAFNEQAQDHQFIYRYPMHLINSIVKIKL